MNIELNKIYNMDCIEGMKLIPDNTIDLVITSPPYNVGIQYDSWNDLLSKKEYFDFMNQWLFESYRILKDDGRIALNLPFEVNMKKQEEGRVFLISEIWNIMQQIGYNWAGIVLLKEKAPHRVKHTAWGSFNSPSSPYIYNSAEGIIIAYKKQWKKEYQGISYFNQTNKKEFINLCSGIWEYSADTQPQTIATYSLDLPLKALKILSWENDIILDPFSGSGTTAIACKKMKRNYIGFEISKKYYEISKKRISQEYFDFTPLTNKE